MKVLIAGVEYKIAFAYMESNPMGRKKLIRRSIVCELIGADGKPWLAGIAACSPKDNFCRETGRKLALARAITGFDKAQRAAIWAVYRMRGKKTEVAP